MAAPGARAAMGRWWRRFARNPGAVFGLAFFLALVAMAIFAPLLSPYDPIAQGVGKPMAPPSAAHWAGTDSFGRDILGAIVRTIADEGRTVLFSSHLLDEVERVSDCVAMLKAGQLVFAGELANIQHTHHQLTLRTDNADLQPAFLGLLDCQRRGNEWTAIASGDLDDLTIAASSIGAQIIDHRRLSLDEIFLARVGAQSDIPAGAARL